MRSCCCQCRVVDVPVIENFPATSEDEWSRSVYVMYLLNPLKEYIFSCRYPNYGLRTADAYLLVYDMSTPDSFNYITFIREQIAMSRGLTDVPMVVVANKADLGAGSDIRDCSEKYRHDIVNKVVVALRTPYDSHHLICSH